VPLNEDSGHLQWQIQGGLIRPWPQSVLAIEFGPLWAMEDIIVKKEMGVNCNKI